MTFNSVQAQKGDLVISEPDRVQFGICFAVTITLKDIFPQIQSNQKKPTGKVKNERFFPFL